MRLAMVGNDGEVRGRTALTCRGSIGGRGRVARRLWGSDCGGFCGEFCPIGRAPGTASVLYGYVSPTFIKFRFMNGSNKTYSWYEPKPFRYLYFSLSSNVVTGILLFRLDVFGWNNLNQ